MLLSWQAVTSALRRKLEQPSGTALSPQSALAIPLAPIGQTLQRQKDPHSHDTYPDVLIGQSPPGTD